ncbi:hypothetical protein, partial [Streptomyces sp. NPDC001020]
MDLLENGTVTPPGLPHLLPVLLRSALPRLTTAPYAHFTTDDLLHALAVLTREVVDAAGGWLALERGVSAVVIVGVQPG